MSFVNNVWICGVGLYEFGMKVVMMWIFNDYVCWVNFLKEKDKNFEGSDICEGFLVVFFICVLEKIF